MPDDPQYEAEDYQTESGATSGRTHESVLEQTIGRERALRNVTAGGPMQVPTPPDAASVSDRGVVDERSLRRRQEAEKGEKRETGL